MISKIKKLKGRSIAELADRLRQKALVVVERNGFSRELRAWSDIDFLSQFGASVSSAEQLLDHLRGRSAGTFYPVFPEREVAIRTLHDRFPDEPARVVAAANKICSGRFDLLGYQGLDFGSPLPDWHFEPVSGKRSPLTHWSRINEVDASQTGDKKIVWELNRHQYLTVLGSAYWITGNEAYAATAFAHVEDWIEKNPPKLGLNWISSLEIAFRSISWIWVMNYFVHSVSLKPKILLGMLKGLAQNARHIEQHLSTYSSPNTHLTGEALGLYMIGCWLPELRDAARWKGLGYRILIEQLEKQVRKDGGFIEQSVHYQRYTADFYLTLMILRRAEGTAIEESFIENLRKLLHFLMFAMQPNGRTPLIGDDDGGRLHFFDDRPIDDLRSTLALGAALLGDPDLKFAAGEPTAELLWLGGSRVLNAFDAIEARVPGESRKGFPESGLYSIRSGWSSKSNHLLIDCGPHGFLSGGHAHADALGFILSVDGTPVFVDSGTFSYTQDQSARNYFRSSAAHNCLTVNGDSSSIPSGPFAWKAAATSELLEWTPSEDGALFRGTHDGFNRFGVRYERDIYFQNKGETRIVDKIVTTVRNSIELHLILDPAISAEILNQMTVRIRTKEGNIELLTIDTKLTEAFECAGWQLEDANISPRYGSLVKTTKLVLTVVADGDFDIVNRMVPSGI